MNDMIKNALRICAIEQEPCEGCPFHKTQGCMEQLKFGALTVIAAQEKEIETLKKIIEQQIEKIQFDLEELKNGNRN